MKKFTIALMMLCSICVFQFSTFAQGPITLNPVAQGSHLGFDIQDIADLNNDGIMEFTLGSQGRVEIRNFNCTGIIGYGPQQWRGMTTGEFLHVDNDGYIDLAVSNTIANNIIFYKNNGSGGFSQVLQTYSSTYPFRLASGDYDNDGDEDLLVGGWHQNTYILRNDNGTFVLAATLAGTNHRAYALEWADLDGDLDLDVIIGGQITNPSGDIPIVWENTGYDTFVARWFGTYAMYQYMQYVRVGDVDADGDIDFMLCVYDGNWGKFARILQNDGNFNFTHVINVPGIFRHLADWGDFDGDGDLEILYLEPFEDPNHPGTQYAYGGHPAIYDYDITANTFTQVWSDQNAVFQHITAADFDGDGAIDFHGHWNPGVIYLNGHTLEDCGQQTPSNQDPDCSGAAIADQCAGENGTAVISGADVTGITDPDGDDLTITVSPTTLYPGTTSVTVYADDGNGGSCTIDINVTVNQATADAGDDATIYIGYPPYETQLNATGGVTYNWTPEDGLSDPTHADPVADPEESTLYVVTVTDANGCTDSDDVLVEVNDVRCGKKNNKVLICHVPPGNPGNAHTICVSPNAVPAHLAHGDYLGECTNGPNKPTTELAAENLHVTVAPNPFNNRTNIHIQLHDDANVEAAVYNMTGMKIRTLKNGMLSAGNHTISWNGQSDDGNVVRVGLYILRVTAGDESSHNKLMKN
ncbi:MAG: VCBS repeat-containing protein [Bacteroidales bacterium]|nr:VCBS repeat-containing protein [Bacteroidota bacterium]MBL6949375.1 VCBS repeat-containing protein [Bacteroidales bacterium]